MWSLLSRRLQVLIIVALTLLLAGGLDTTYALLTESEAGPLKWASLVTTLILAAVGLAANLLWRPVWRAFPVLNRLIFPDLNGDWQCVLHSTYISPETGAGIPPIDGSMTIRLTLWKLSVSLTTRESTSHSTRSFLEPISDEGRFRIWYSYNNDPKAQVQHRSSPHEGVAFLETVGAALGDRLEGRYYTARKTTGDMILTRAETPPTTQA